MGGDAFPDTERLSEAEYARICGEVRLVLDTALVRYGVPVEVADKAEICRERGKDKPYGDVDVIIAIGDQNKRLDIVDKVKNAVGLEEGKILRNDTTYSFLT